MAGMKLSNLQIEKIIPRFMRSDEAVVAMCKALNKIMSEPCGNIKNARTWDRYDYVSENECDELAWELDVDWYDSSASLAEKRKMIKQAQQIKRKRGTKWAVEQLVSVYFGTGYVIEWFDTPEICDGPYTFCVLSDSEISEENYSKFLESAAVAKNERSHVSGIYFYWFIAHEVICSSKVDLHSYGYRICGTHPEPAVAGISNRSEIDSRCILNEFFYKNIPSGRISCGTYPDTATKGYSELHTASAEFSCTASVYSYVSCGTRRCGQDIRNSSGRRR